MTDTKVTVNVPGCLITIIALIGVWALLFGVNYNGKHYGVSCGSKGVDVNTGLTQ